MKITQPAKSVDVCDRCENEGYLQACVVCGAQFCLRCQTTMAGCWVQPKVCMACAKRGDVRAIVAAAADEMTPIINKRREDLARLGADSTEGTEAADSKTV